MQSCFIRFEVLTHPVEVGGREAPFFQSSPDIIGRLLRRVLHIRRVEAIISQFIVHNLVRRKIKTRRRWLRIAVRGRAEAIYGQEERGFAQFVGVQAVFNIAIRTQGKDKAAGRRTRQGAEESLPRLDHIFDGEQTLFKSRTQFFMAVGHAAPIGLQMIDVVRAEGNKYGIGLLPKSYGLLQRLFCFRFAFGLGIGRPFPAESPTAPTPVASLKEMAFRKSIRLQRAQGLQYGTSRKG